MVFEAEGQGLPKGCLKNQRLAPMIFPLKIAKTSQIN
jgi:hypothetical protein